MKNLISKLDRWHKTKLGLAFFAIIELAITYGFASLAINDGSLFYYLFTVIFLIGFLQNFFRLIAQAIKGFKHD